MTLFFDNKVNFGEDDVVSTIFEWHSTESLLAVASYSQNKGGIISIIDEYVCIFNSEHNNDLIII